MLLKLALSIGLLTAVGAAPSFAQTTSDTRSPTLGDPGAKPAAPTPPHRMRLRHPPKPGPSTGVGNAPDRAAAGGGGR